MERTVFKQRVQMVLFAPIYYDLRAFGSKMESIGVWNYGVSSKMVLLNHREIEMVFYVVFHQERCILWIRPLDGLNHNVGHEVWMVDVRVKRNHQENEA